MILKLVTESSHKNWKDVSLALGSKTAAQCASRWKNILDPCLTKDPWSFAEDELLKKWVANFGPTRWSQCSERIHGRTGKACRERWFTSVNPNISKEVWTISEDYLIMSLFDKINAKWSKMVPFFSGRSENNLKNRFHSCLRRTASQDVTYKGKKSSAHVLSTTELIQFFKATFEDKKREYVNFANKYYMQGSLYVEDLEESIVRRLAPKMKNAVFEMNEQLSSLSEKLTEHASVRSDVWSNDDIFDKLSNAPFLIEDEQKESSYSFIEESLSNNYSTVMKPKREFKNNHKTNEGIYKNGIGKIVDKLELLERWIKQAKAQIIITTEKEQGCERSDYKTFNEELFEGGLFV